MTFTEIFNELLAERELNRKQFAEQSGIPYTTVSGWTTLGRLPDYTALIKIADFFNCSIDFLTGRQDEYSSYGSSRTEGQEKYLLNLFRKLDTENRELVLKLIKNLSVKK